MAIKEKYYNPDRFRSVQNLDSLRVTRKHKPKVLIGDSPDIRTCTWLYSDRVVHNQPSYWRSRYPDGWIIFASGKIYDRKRGTIDGKQAFILFYGKDTEIILLKHNLKVKIIAILEIVSNEEFRVVFELLCERAGWQCKEWEWWAECKEWWTREWAEECTVSQLETMSLRELRDFADLLEGPAGSAISEDPTKAA
jgi:hypothetical protein